MNRIFNNSQFFRLNYKILMEMIKMATNARGFRKVMRMSESDARSTYAKKLSEREQKVMKLKEKFEHTKGLAFGNGKLDEMFNKDAKKASNLLLFLENTEKNAWNNPTLLQNANQVDTIRNLSESRMTEAMQTGGAMALMVPSDIVKIARIGYTNSVAQDIFDVWGMTSMKDSIYKLETIVGSTERGATEGDVIYEKYGDGRYPSVIEEEDLTATSSTVWGKTLTNHPIIPFKVEVYYGDTQIGIDNGNGGIIGDNITSGSINYATGVVSVTLKGAYDEGESADISVRYAYDFEEETLFSKTGSVLLNLVEYNFSAILYPLALEWTRFTEDLMNSKLGLGAKDMLIAGAGDEFRKAFDEYCINKGIKASSWHSGINFNCDYSTAGADNSYEHAQSVLNAIISSEALTYDQLGRLADTTNIVCDSASYSYLTKHRQFTSVTPTSKVGIFQVGEISGRKVYMAPKSVVNPAQNKGVLYLFGKSTQGQNVDAPVSVGSYGSSITTNPVELKNFNSQMGLGMYLDIKTNNKFFATKVILDNLTPNA